MSNSDKEWINKHYNKELYKIVEKDEKAKAADKENLFADEYAPSLELERGPVVISIPFRDSDDKEQKARFKLVGFSPKQINGLSGELKDMLTLSTLALILLCP